MKITIFFLGLFLTVPAFTAEESIYAKAFAEVEKSRTKLKVAGEEWDKVLEEYNEALNAYGKAIDKKRITLIKKRKALEEYNKAFIKYNETLLKLLKEKKATQGT